MNGMSSFEVEVSDAMEGEMRSSRHHVTCECGVYISVLAKTVMAATKIATTLTMTTKDKIRILRTYNIRRNRCL